MDKDKLINILMEEKGGTREQYLSLLNKVAYHESAHTMDPTIKQYGGGPGRGKYQFEEGKNRGGITAARRTKKYLDSIGQPIPEWLQEATQGNSLDATKLDSEQQDILFLGNMRMHPRADFSNYVEGKESVEDFWANYHWAGADEDRPDRLASFSKSMQSFTPAERTPAQKTELVASNNPSPVQTQVDNTFVASQDYSQMKFKQEPQQPVEQEQPAQEKADPYQDLIAYVNKKSEFNEFNTGGKHEQNPHGGIPQGMGANNKPNTVEEGETSFDFGNEKFIFSDRVSLTDYINKKQFKGTNNQFALGGSMNNTDPTDPKLKTAKKQDNTNVSTNKYKMESNPLNIDSIEDKTRGFVLDYLKSDPYKKRLNKSGYNNPEKTTRERIKNVEDVSINYQNREYSFMERLGKTLTGEDYATHSSVYYPQNNNIVMRPDINKDVPETMIHEMGHGVESANRGNNFTGLSDRDKKEFSNRLIKENILNKHDEKPSENYSDLLSVRYMLKEAGVFDSTKEENITMEHLVDFIDKGGHKKELWNRMLRLYKPEDIIWLMNNIASNDKLKKTKSRLT